MLGQAMTFEFRTLGPAIDGELELIAPETRWIDPLLRSCAHPQCAGDPAAASTTRARAMDFLRVAPAGRQPPEPQSGRVPCYHFWMKLNSVGPFATEPPPIEIAGGCALRIGSTTDLEYYVGHVGYNVYPPAQGHHYAERSCRLLLPLARAHGIKRLWITCNPDNVASRRTCERLGCQFADIVPVPANHPLYLRGDKEKCRYWLDL
jgi:predicted acetyltransferase